MNTQDNMINGPYKTYHSNGAIHIQAMYSAGKIIGEYREYYEDGTINVYKPADSQETTVYNVDGSIKETYTMYYEEDAYIPEVDNKYCIAKKNTSDERISHYYFADGTLQLIHDFNGDTTIFYKNGNREYQCVDYGRGKGYDNFMQMYYYPDGKLHRLIDMICYPFGTGAHKQYELVYSEEGKLTYIYDGYCMHHYREYFLNSDEKIEKIIYHQDAGKDEGETKYCSHTDGFHEIVETNKFALHWRPNSLKNILLDFKEHREISDRYRSDDEFADNLINKLVEECQPIGFA